MRNSAILYCLYILVFFFVLFVPKSPADAQVSPSVSTTGATNTTSTSTTLTGSLISTGGDTFTIEGFEYGFGTTSQDMIIATTSASFDTGSFGVNLTSLNCNTTYYYMAFASSSSAIATGTEQTFTTANTDPMCGTVAYSVNNYGIQSLSYNGVSFITSPVNGYGDGIKYVTGLFQTPGGATTTPDPNPNGAPIQLSSGTSTCPQTKLDEQCYEHIYRSGLNDSYTLTVEFSTYSSSTLLTDIYVTNNDPTDTMDSFGMGYWLGFVMNIPDLLPHWYYGGFDLAYTTTPAALISGDNWGSMAFYTDDYSKKVTLSTSNTYDTTGDSIPPTNVGAIWNLSIGDQIGPEQTYHYALYTSFATTTVYDATSLAPQAYTAWQSLPANEDIVNWPDRAPVSQWFIAEGVGNTSILNPRGYLWNSTLDVSNQANFDSQVLSLADNIITMMNGENPRPQAIDIWDLEGEEFAQYFTYVGYPNKLHDLAPEMDAVADQLAAKFRNAGYQLALTLRPGDFQTGPLADLPDTCTNGGPNVDADDIYIATDVAYPNQGYICTAPNTWTNVSRESLYHQHSPQDDPTLLANLESKVAYARSRWGVKMYYIDSTVYSYNGGGGPFNFQILRDLQTAFPDCVFFPENINLNDYGTAVPYTDARPGASTSGWDTPQSARDLYPMAFSIISNADSYIPSNQSMFIQSVKNGNIFYDNNAWFEPDTTVEDLYQSADYTPAPLVGFTAPANNGTVSGNVTLTATSTYYLNSGVQGVRFVLDGNDIGPLITATSAPNTYTYTWNSASAAEGTHTLSAVTSDYIGNYATTSISVIVNNGSTAPGLATLPSTSVSSSTATLNANIISTGGGSVTQSGFAYGTSPTLTSGVSTTTLGSQSGAVGFSQSINNLAPNTTYYVRAYAVNGNGTSTGLIVPFTTVPLVPIVATQVPTVNSGSTIIANGSITSTQGSNADAEGFVYGTDIQYSTTTVLYGASTTESGSFGASNFNFPITGLSCDTVYYVVAYATNVNGTSYGPEQSATTGSCDMSAVSSQSASSIGQTGAVLNGTMTDDGNASSTVEGFNWGTDTTYGYKAIRLGTFGDGSFSYTLSNLTCGTTYHYQAYTVNYMGTATSSDQSFITNACSSGGGGGGISSGGGGGGSSGGGSISTISLSSTLGTSTCTTTPAKVPPLPVVALSLTQGSTGTAVKNLQTYLVIMGYLPSKDITGYYGTLTKAAIAKYIANYTLLTVCPATATSTPTTASFCPIGFTCSPLSTPPTSTVSIPAFTRTLTLGSIGPDVKNLQIFLNNHGFTIAKSGNGSPGHETTYFGPATKTALIRFQDANAAKILEPYGLTKGTGVLGENTRKVINSLN